MRRRPCGELRATDTGQKVLLQGWIHQRRPHGGLTFLNLRDRSGIVQVVLRPEEHETAAAALDPARLEWVVEVVGEIVERGGAVNPDMPTGEIEVVAEQARVVSRADPLPFGPETPVDEVTEETRLRYRFLDLRRADLQRNLLLRDQIDLEIRRYFHDQGFVHVETPILTRSTPEGARDYLVPSRVHQGSFYALPQSPQLFKQILMVSGLDRYVQIARCFRDEDLRADRQPEFTQVDVEMSFPTEDDIHELIEGLFARLFPIVGIELETPFPRLTYAECMRRFGSDKPDLRFGMEIVELTERLGTSAFRGFRQTMEEGGVIRAIVVPDAGDASRKVVDGWAEVARGQGAAGVLTLRFRDGEPVFQVKDVLTPEETAWAVEQTEMTEGDLTLIVAAGESTAARALGELRTHIAGERDLIDHERHEFLWVTRFPLVERDAAGEWTSCNHPFTAPLEDDLDRLDSDPGSVRARAYDVVLNGVELGGGSIRIHDPGLQQRVFGLLGLDAVEAKSRFGFLLEALRYGAPPHGGIALGLDRLVMMMAGASSLRDVIAFPKSTSAACLMTEAPSPVDPDQLAELGIAPGGRKGSDPESG